MTFKVGDKVKIIRKSIPGEIYWNPLMNKAIGNTYTILAISILGNLRLNTRLDTSYDYLYPPKGVDNITRKKNRQLEFSFMESEI